MQSMEEEDLPNAKKRERDDESPEADGVSPDAKRLREDILDDFDDEAAESAGGGEQLSVFMKILKEEITGAEEECGGSRTDLGYLLEATDDELGLPPTAAESPDRSGFLERCFEIGGEYSSPWEEMASFEDPFGFGSEETDYLTLDGLFDFSGGSFGSGDPFLRSMAQQYK